MFFSRSMRNTLVKSASVIISAASNDHSSEGNKEKEKEIKKKVKKRVLMMI